MKKFILFLTALFIFAISSSLLVCAEEDYSNYFGVIRDKDGNVIETIPFPTERFLYVDTPYTLPPGGTFTSYQYEPSIGFYIGFAYSTRGTSSSSVTHTTRDRKVKLEVFNASSIGGARYMVKSGIYSTNKEDNYDDTTGTCLLGVSSISSIRPYYNGVITNVSSQSLTIVVNVVCD